MSPECVVVVLAAANNYGKVESCVKVEERSVVVDKYKQRSHTATASSSVLTTIHYEAGAYEERKMLWMKGTHQPTTLRLLLLVGSKDSASAAVVVVVVDDGCTEPNIAA